MNEGRKHDEPLAQWADRTLRQLPDRRAPSTLAPRVLARIAQRRVRAWYRQPWFEWPRAYQIGAGCLAAALITIAMWVVWPHAESVNLDSAKQVATQFEPVREVSTVAGVVNALVGAALVVLKSLSGWALVGILAGFALIWSTTLGLGTACWRLAMGSQRYAS